MKSLRYLTSSFFLLLLLGMTSCNDRGKYEITENNVYFTYWTFSFGTLRHPLPEVNPETFKSLKDWLGHDGNHVYFTNKLVPGADPVSLQPVKYPLFRDQKDFYYDSIALQADVNSFEPLKWDDDDVWAKDKNHVYYNNRHIEGADPATFEVKRATYAIDKNHVYRWGELLPLADPKTYKEGRFDLYGMDKNHVWYLGTLVEDADRASFKEDKDGYAHDKHGKFFNGERIQDEEADN